MSEHVATIGVIIASIAVMVTFVGVLLSNKSTKESNDMLSKEFKQKLRPWIKFGEIAPKYGVFKNNRIEEWDMVVSKKEVPEFVRVTESFINIGSTQCSVVSLMDFDYVVFGRERFDVKMNTDSPAIMMPNEAIYKQIPIPFEKWRDKNENPIYIGLVILYRINDEIQAKTGRIWRLTSDGFAIIDNWYEEIKG